jgi:RHS repeat-associated protein
MPQTTFYEWDETNRLSAVVYPDGSREEYEYSADGLRRSKTTAAQTPEPQTTRFVWDGENLLQELGNDSEVRARYTYLAGGYGPLVSQRRSDSSSSPAALFNAVGFGSALFNQAGSTPSADSVSSFFGYDLSANTRFLNDAAGGVTGRYLDTAFGKEVLTAGAMNNPFRFGGAVGYYRDGAERDYVRARYLRKERWISRDPIGFAGGDWNLYRYVENNPVIGVDPSGLQGGNLRGGSPRDRYCNKCGPEIGSLLSGVLRQVRSDFNSWSESKRLSACISLNSIETGAGAWDIWELNTASRGNNGSSSSDAFRRAIKRYGCAISLRACYAL